MDTKAKILIVGHDDAIERSLVGYLNSQGYRGVVSTTKIGLDPTIQPSVYEYFQKERPEYVFLGSILSGGIQANRENPAEFMYQNIESQNNIIYAAWKFGVTKLVYIGASCGYPKDCPQPMKEEHLLMGELEPTSEPYSLAKLAGIKLCQAFRKQYQFNAVSIIPATVYGREAHRSATTSHVIGALIEKFKSAVEQELSEVEVWGTGEARREFIYSDDFARAALLVMTKYENDQPLNVGCGQDVSIRDLAQMIAESTGFTGKIVFNKDYPDGAKQKLLDSARIAQLGFKAKVSLKEGIQKIV